MTKRIFDYRDNTLMLLGSASQNHLDYRKEVRDELLVIGYTNIVIMEEIVDKLTDKSLDDKYHRIIKEYDPTLFVAFFHRGAKMDGVTFELGWLCCKYHSKRLGRRLRILYETGYKWKETTAYISDLFFSVPKVEFNESKRYSKASQCIHKCVLRLI